ncbi:MAG TPA: adenylate/guanylate cyclase domain-containing protein [Pyrinomonadaceae bacterium]|jgi:adenylate cyclase
MAERRKFNLASYLLRRWYWALALTLAVVIWGALALAMRPLADANGKLTSNPYGLVTSLEEFGLDILFQMRSVLHPATRDRGRQEPITVIGVDEEAIRASNIRLQKWPRSYYAQLIDRASQGGASVIGVDVYFSEAGGLSEQDKADDRQLLDAISNAGNVVLVKKLAEGGSEPINPLPEFIEAASAVGFADLPHDSDGFVRTAALGHLAADGTTESSFASYIAQLYADKGVEFRPPDEQRVLFGDKEIPLRNDANIQIDFRSRTPGFQYVSARDILFKQDAISDEMFKDRIVLIGATNNDAPDLFNTPFYKPGVIPTFWARVRGRQINTAPALMPGVEIHGNIVATMLFGQYLKQISYTTRVLMLFLVIGLVTLAVFKFRASLGALTVVVVAVGVLGLSASAFNRRALILPLMTSELAVGVLALSGFLLRYAHERAVREEKEAERAQIMDIFSRAVSPEVADELWERREGLHLGGERRVVTLIFTDIRGFTTLSESVSSEVVVTWLNEYFSRMHRIITSYGGHINKYIGDGLMIVFGAPIARGDKLEARAAVACGLDMLDEVERINQDWEGTGRPKIKIGVGIHTGVATCGVVGAEGRLEYTIIGDTVNLASRLESTTKEKGVGILISDATAQLLGQDYETHPLGDVLVKGKTLNTSVFAVERANRKRTAELAPVA